MFLSCSCLFDVRAISAVILFLFDVRARSAVVPPPLLARVRGTKCRRASPSHRLLRCGSDAHLLKKPIGLRQEPAALSRQVSMGAQPFQASMYHTRSSHSSDSGGARWYWLRSAPAPPPCATQGPRRRTQQHIACSGRSRHLVPTGGTRAPSNCQTSLLQVRFEVAAHGHLDWQLTAAQDCRRKAHLDWPQRQAN